MKHSIHTVLLAGILAPSLGSAHALLQQASPSDGSVVQAPPQSFVFTFSENARLTALSIQRQDTGTPQHIALPGASSRHFVITAPRLAPGDYTIRYRIVSTDDGHITGGAIHFTLTAGGAVGPPAPSVAAADGYSAVGTVQGVDETAGRVTISHEPIAGLGWPAMTMTFAVKDRTLYDKLAAGRRVRFTLAKQGALYVVTSVR